MVFRLRRHHRSASDHRGPRADAAAYVLLEEARLRCARLSDRPGEGATVELAHRALGMAGYLARAGISPDQRPELLAIAHKHAADPVKDEVRGLIQTALGAGRTAELTRAGPMLDEPVQVAQAHLDHALELLRRRDSAQVN
jgi:hypothetical protein